MTGVIPADCLGLAPRLLESAGITRRNQAIVTSIHEEERCRLGLTNEVNRFYGIHQFEQRAAFRFRQLVQRTTPDLRASEVSHETTVSGEKHTRPQAPFDPREKPSHRRTIAGPEVAEALVIDIVACDQQVDVAA
jgi:hypothetical protein